MLSLGRSKALAALGLILTLVIAVVALVTQTRQAQASSNAIAPWSDSLAEYGMPAAPTLWKPSNFDVQIIHGYAEWQRKRFSSGRPWRGLRRPTRHTYGVELATGGVRLSQSCDDRDSGQRLR